MIHKQITLLGADTDVRDIIAAIYSTSTIQLSWSVLVFIIAACKRFQLCHLLEGMKQIHSFRFGPRIFLCENCEKYIQCIVVSSYLWLATDVNGMGNVVAEEQTQRSSWNN